MTIKFISSAAMVYYFFMAYLAWLNLIMVNLWKTTVLRKWTINERTWLKLNHFYGWLTPFIWLLISIILAVTFKEHLDNTKIDGYELSIFSNQNMIDKNLN